jgi:hypothetical protein
MSTLVVDMKIREKSPHAHGKRGHGTHFLIIYRQKPIGPGWGGRGIAYPSQTCYAVFGLFQ